MPRSNVSTTSSRRSTRPSTNVIVHGYRGDPGWLDIGIALEDEQFVVRIEDEAPSFDPTSVPNPT